MGWVVNSEVQKPNDVYRLCCCQSSLICMETEVLQVQKVMVCDFRYFWWTSICFVCLICVSKFIACDCFLLIDGSTKFNYNVSWLNNNSNNNNNNNNINIMITIFIQGAHFTKSDIQ